MAAHFLIVLTACCAQLYTLLTETATITIIPKSAVVTAHLTLSNVHSRIFSPVTLTQHRTVPATGNGHQDATQAHGVVTFYNALPQEQTIQAGTLLTASNGELFLTDSEVTIPAGTYTANGQAGVTATAQNFGTEGNIAAGEIHGLCCRAGILVLNTAFYGGQNKRDYTMVTQHDITNVVSTLAPLLMQTIHSSFQQQIRRDEVLTPTQCSQHISTDRNAGDEATQVTVTVSQSCIAGAYNTRDFQTEVQQAVAQQAEHTIGNGYTLASYALTAPLRTAIQQGRLTLIGTCEGHMLYHFSTRELTILRQQLAGKTRQQGGALLAHLNGANHITVQVGNNATFPTDPTHIHIVFLIVS